MMCTNNSAVVNGRVSLVGSSILSEQQRQKVTEKKGRLVPSTKTTFFVCNAYFMH
jgi:hypothetical protein